MYCIVVLLQFTEILFLCTVGSEACVAIAAYLSIIATVLESLHSNPSIAFLILVPIVFTRIYLNLHIFIAVICINCHTA